MVKLSIFLAFLFGFFAFARAGEQENKLAFGEMLCQQGHADQYQRCHEKLQQSGLTQLSYFRLTSELCPVAGGNSGQLALRCFNSANQHLKLNIRVCNSEKTYRARVLCVKTIVTQADNLVQQEALTSPKGRLKTSHDNSQRVPVEKSADSDIQKSPSALSN